MRPLPANSGAFERRVLAGRVPMVLGLVPATATPGVSLWGCMHAIHGMHGVTFVLMAAAVCTCLRQS
jgi:hypothetical protein